MTARQDIAWRAKAHAEGRTTNLDGIPNILLYAIHIAWAITRRVRARTAA